ncbi:hypothetical protein B0T18DRAFT_213058 [Schizothecium vesticola]|uniref:Secreted protein n=1 Tax=Schizothecium vesticola TaxID=314040 RepID=A0AA40EJR5_9PEZI|nr:hypothetical protein B0T18DRAFT_213058 [Schizothecium vesticola]
MHLSTVRLFSASSFCPAPFGQLFWCISFCLAVHVFSQHQRCASSFGQQVRSSSTLSLTSIAISDGSLTPECIPLGLFPVDLERYHVSTLSRNGSSGHNPSGGEEGQGPHSIRVLPGLTVCLCMPNGHRQPASS